MSAANRALGGAGKARSQVETIWRAGIEGVSPRRLIAREIHENPELVDQISKCGRVLLLGAGKAARAMVEGALDALPSGKEVVGWIHVVDGQEGEPIPGCRLVGVRPVAENYPTERGLSGSERQIELAGSAREGDLGLVLLSGGASAMMPLPVQGITLAEKLQVTKLLHASGASITEMNTVRKQLSRIKGGGLAEAWSGSRNRASLWTLAISDVVGDEADVIGSGPTVPDRGSAQGAMECLERYGLRGKVPPSVIRVLEAKQGEQKKEDLIATYPWSRFVLAGNNRKAVKAARAQAEAMGWRVLDLGSSWELEAGNLAKVFQALARNIVQNEVGGGPPLCVLLGGEAHLKVCENPGAGGRNQHLALLLIGEMDLPWLANSSWLMGGTDGEDGPTDAAGGFADVEALYQLRKQGIDWSDAIRKFSSYETLTKAGALLKTGHTGTNVADLWVGLIGRS